MQALIRGPRRLIALLAFIVAMLALGAPAAQAGPLVSSATDCDDQAYEQPFLPWADPASYVLAPNGNVENGDADWALSGAAAVVSGNESYYVHGAGESSSLRLQGGSSATTASMCVGIEHPTIRFFARNAGSQFSTLRVDVLFEDAAGQVHALSIGTVGGGSSWQPTLPAPVVANLLPLLPNERTAVAFRFTPQGYGSDWRIDDVYVDPWRH